MTRTIRVAAIYLGLAFLAGGLFGFLTHSLYSQRPASASNPKEFRERYVARLQSNLSLTPEQLAQVTAILDDTGQRFRELRERMSPEFQAIRDAQRARIMTLLTPEQQPKYQKILEDHQRNLSQRQKQHR